MRRYTFALVALGLLASTVVAGAVPAGAAPPAAARGSGSGHAVAPRTVNMRDVPLAAPPAAGKSRPNAMPDGLGGPRRRPLPSRPTTGHRPQAAPGTAAGRQGAAAPRLATGTVSSFSGIDQNLSFCGGCEPPDVNAAVGSTQIMEVTNLALQVWDKKTLTSCSNFRSLAGFLNSGGDVLSDPRVEYDNLQRRFSFSITVVPSGNSTPAMWVAASMSDDACGAWFVYRLTFSGPAFPSGTLLDYPILGQDQNALLFGTDNFTPGGENFSVFGIAKSQVYFGSPIGFSTFGVASLSAPVTNGGFPMINTPFSYFLSAVPGVGYRLYRLTNSGGPGASITLQATISSPFNAPSRRVNQPGTSATLDPLDGRIVWSPVNDGTRIWFAHGLDDVGFPTVRYGAITIATNALSVAIAFHSGTSDDFNPSVGVGIGFNGSETVYLNWAYTDSPAGIATSDTVDSYVSTDGQVLLRFGVDVPTIHGGVTSEDRFGDYSSVAIDPSVIDGSCAVAAQQTFVFGEWETEISRIGNC